jgi:hypothetical protein
MRNFLKIKKKLATLFCTPDSGQNGGWKLTENRHAERTDESEEVQDQTLEKEEERKKARLRKRGPYRKAHADW